MALLFCILTKFNIGTGQLPLSILVYADDIIFLVSYCFPLFSILMRRLSAAMKNFMRMCIRNS